MSYDDSVGKYLVPDIAVGVTTAGPLIEMDIGAASADHGEMVCVRQVEIKRLKFTLVGELAGGSSTAPTVVFTKRPTPRSATAESVMGTLTIPDTTAIGKTLYLDIDPVSLSPGQSMEIAHTVGVGTPTGQGFWSVVPLEDPEDPLNDSNMVLSS